MPPCPLFRVPSCLLTSWLHTVYIRILVFWWAFPTPPTFGSLDCTHYQVGLHGIWAPHHIFLHTLVSLLDINSSGYFPTKYKLVGFLKRSYYASLTGVFVTVTNNDRKPSRYLFGVCLNPHPFWLLHTAPLSCYLLLPQPLWKIMLEICICIPQTTNW